MNPLPKSHTYALGSTMAYIVVLLSASFYLYEFFLRVMPTVITQELMLAFSVGTGSLGQLIGCFFYAYALMQVPAGLLCDRFGPRVCLVASIFVCTAATLIFQCTNSFAVAAATRLAIGAASAFAFVGPMALANRWFPADKQALIAGCIQIMGCVGAIFAGNPIRMMINQIGWRSALYYSGVVGVVLTLAFVMVLRDRPQSTPREQTDQPSHVNLWHVLKRVLSKPANWMVGCAAFASWAAVAVFAESWGVPYLSLIQQQSDAQTAQQLMWVWIAMAIASPVAGWWSNAVKERVRPIMILLSIGLVASLVLIVGQPSQPWLVSLLLFALGVSSAAQPVTFGLINDLNDDDTMATAIAFNNTVLVSSAGILLPICGYVLEYYAPSAGGMPQTVAPFQAAFMIVPVIMLLCMVVFYYNIHETHCQNVNVDDQAEDGIAEHDEVMTGSASA